MRSATNLDGQVNEADRAESGENPSTAVKAGLAALAARDWDGAYRRLQAASDAAALDAESQAALAQAAFATGRVKESLAAYERAYSKYDEAGAALGAGSCAVALAEAYAITGRPAIANGWRRRARNALVGAENSAAYGNLLVSEAWSTLGAGRSERASEQARQALELGRQLRDPDLQAVALHTIGAVLVAQGEVVDGLANYDESMLFALEGRLSPQALGLVYCAMIAVCEDLGELRRASEWTAALTEWIEEHPFAIFPGICRVHRATVLQRRGAWTSAEDEARRACADFERHHLPVLAALGHAEIGEIRRRLGDLRTAEFEFLRAEELSGQPQPGLALLRLAQGRIAPAKAIADRALAEQGSNRLARAKVLPVYVQVALAFGDIDMAQRAAEELDATATATRGPALLAAASTSRGRVRIAEREPGPACVALRDALARWQDLSVPYEVGTVRLLLGEACRQAGDEDGAQASFSAAAHIFEPLGALADLQRAHHELHARRELPAGLTEREAEVLRLVAAGLPNKDIAATLWLSEKTVARHLSNIFTKIGVSTRTAATAFAFDKGLVGRQA